MRIIAGKYKGRLIQFPRHIRPTQDKVRQSIFDVLAVVVKGSRVLDLFAGSGAFGLEALSRGAASVLFIDNDRRSSRLVRRNLDTLGLAQDKAVEGVFTQDVFRGIKILSRKKREFDLVFLDPPYHKELAKKALKTLGSSGILAPRSFVLVEHSKKDDLGAFPGTLKLIKEFAHGDTKVSILHSRGGVKGVPESDLSRHF